MYYYLAMSGQQGTVESQAGSLLTEWLSAVSCYAANAAKRHSRSKARSFRAWRRREQSRRSEADSSFQPGGVAGRKTGQRLRLCGGLFSVRKDHVRLSLPDADRTVSSLGRFCFCLFSLFFFHFSPRRQNSSTAIRFAISPITNHLPVDIFQYCPLFQSVRSLKHPFLSAGPEDQE